MGNCLSWSKLNGIKPINCNLTMQIKPTKVSSKPRKSAASEIETSCIFPPFQYQTESFSLHPQYYRTFTRMAATVELSEEDKVVTSIALVRNYKLCVFSPPVTRSSFLGNGFKAMAILALPEELHQQADPIATTDTVGRSFVYLRQCVKRDAQDLMSNVRKSEILAHVVFSEQATIADIEEFSRLIAGTRESGSALKYICKHVESHITESALDVSCDWRFNVISRQFTSVWTKLLRCEGQNRETACKALVLTLLDALSLISTTLGANYDILIHYEVYERLGTLSSILRDSVNQISTEGVRANRGEEHDYERYNSDWIVRAIGKKTPSHAGSCRCVTT